MHGKVLKCHCESIDTPLTWKTLKTAIEALPDLTTWLNLSRDELSARQQESISRRRTFFRKLVEKVVGTNKEEQVKFLIREARKINKNTYVQSARSSIPTPPDYRSLAKIERRQHSHVHKLIDLFLPLAAGSESITSQKHIFENRWHHMHNQSFTVTKIQDMIN